MLQNLLTDRFKIVLHHETRDFPAWELVVAKGGPKLKEAAALPNGTPVAAPTVGGGFSSMKVDADGFVVMPEGQVGIFATAAHGVAHWTCRSCSVSEIFPQLSTFPLASVKDGFAAPAHIIDRTNLNGKYDFTLDFARTPNGGLADGPPPPSTDASDPAPDLFSALEKQLGLKLQKTKIPMDVLVIDHIERMPIGN
jgi:uncharacterized protein (TIGR03435 family)